MARAAFRRLRRAKLATVISLSLDPLESCPRLLLLLSAASIAAAQPTVLLDAMSQELNRNFSALKEKADPPPYFLSYEITEQEFRSVTRHPGHGGFLHRRQEPRARCLGPRRHAQARQLPPRARRPRAVHLGRARLLRGQRQRHQTAPVAGNRPRLSHGGGAPDPHQDQHPGQGRGGRRFRRFLDGIRRPSSCRRRPSSNSTEAQWQERDPQVLRRASRTTPPCSLRTSRCSARPIRATW